MPRLPSPQGPTLLGYIRHQLYSSEFPGFYKQYHYTYSYISTQVHNWTQTSQNFNN